MRAALNLVAHGIDALVVIGGDGSLTGADTFRVEWEELLDGLVTQGAIERTTADAHRNLALVGLVGSIDNDMFGTDMTIGADTALHRITEAVDALQSTASSHQRTFVIEVMGRQCGYLALMGSLATGANFVLIPESPPAHGWEEIMCDRLRAGRGIGRRASIVLVAEGARDLQGAPVTAAKVKQTLEERLGEDVRVTILGHVQRGGAPSAFDRYLGTVLGYAAVRELLEAPDDEPQVIGIRGHRITRSPLQEAVATTRSVGRVVAEHRSDEAMRLRGGSFTDSYRLLTTLVRARPARPDPEQRQLRLLVLHAGGPAPGMNAAVRVALRVAMNRGHRVVAARHGFGGLVDGEVVDLDWMSVSGWVSRPGAELGTSHLVPDADDATRIEARLLALQIDGILMIGGWAGYEAAHALTERAIEHARLSTPIVCIPASINNDLPATDMSIGADSALNSIVSDVDKIKQSAVGAHRCFVVEVMGHDCGFLPLMSGLATGAELVHLPEEGTSLQRLRDDVDTLESGFAAGKRRGLVLRGEHVDDVYTTGFVESLLTREGGGFFDVRSAILGHLQQGGSPSPYDRIQATRLAAAGVEHLIAQALSDEPVSAMVGFREGKVTFTPLGEFPALASDDAQRPRDAGWWMAVRPVLDVVR